jgi:hypothetical protein
LKLLNQRLSTQTDFQTQELEIDMQTQLLVLSKFQAICSLHDEIAKKLCRFRIREQGARLDSAFQNTIGHALAQLLDTTQGYDTTQGDGETVSKLTIEKVFTVSRDDFQILLT